jgi:glycosyltransferase involved in cell wall biosynthesis
MMMGGVCICSDATGTSYFIRNGENGFIFESENISDMCSCIMQVVDHRSELGDMKSSARKIYEANFKMELFRSNLMRLFCKENEFETSHILTKEHI